MAGWKKGQIWSYDLIIGSIIFAIAMGILAFFWWSTQTNISENKDLIAKESIKVSDLLMSPGIPPNWNELVNLDDQGTWGVVQQFGIVDKWDSNTLSIDKVYKFRQISLRNYSFAKTKLRSRYDFFFELVEINNSVESRIKLNGIDILAGKQYNEMTSKTISKVDRVVLYNNSAALMKVYVWSDYFWD
ncbi:MAG: hypothetical protein QXF56_03355 [Candidatus Micrarchaeia archaeon]